MREDAQELSDELDLEQWFDRESRSFKMSRGQSGMQINAKECPACNDGRWRVYLNAESGIGNCFVCNQTFSKLRFVHLALGHDPENKGDWAATFKHVKDVLGEQGWRPKRRSSVAVEYGEVKLPAGFDLPTRDGRNLVYLEERGIPAELAAYFHLRYSPYGTWSYIHDDGTTRRQDFTSRLIIPVFDLDGTLKTFQGRDVTGTVTDQKYLFPKGLPGTGRYLLNGQNAHRSKRVALGEGFFDVAAMKLAFDGEVALRDVMPVGSFGKHLSYGDIGGNDQLGRFLQLQREGLEEVTIMWDGEIKALEAALQAAEILTRIGLRVRIALLPYEKDPNEVLPEVTREAFWKAEPYTRSLAIRWRLRNPYVEAERQARKSKAAH